MVVQWVNRRFTSNRPKYGQLQNTELANLPLMRFSSFGFLPPPFYKVIIHSLLTTATYIHCLSIRDWTNSAITPTTFQNMQGMDSGLSIFFTKMHTELYRPALNRLLYNGKLN